MSGPIRALPEALGYRGYVHQRQGLGGDDPSLLTGDNQLRPKCNQALAFGGCDPAIQTLAEAC